MYKPNYDCVRTLIVRSSNKTSGTPVDFNVNIRIEEKDYDRIHIQLLSVGIDQKNDGFFPASADTNYFRHLRLNVESNMGQMVFDTNNKRNFLGSVNITRELSRPVHFDGATHPFIELASIPNGNYNFSLRDTHGNIPEITTAGNDTSVQNVTLTFQVYLSKNEIKSNQMHI